MRALAALGALLVLLLAGCGSNSGTTAPSSDESFTLDNWAVLDTDPESHKGASVDVVGRIFRAPERDEDGVYFQMYVGSDAGEFNTVVGSSDTSLSVGDDDYVRVTGTVKGKFEGENAFGGSVSAPVVIADSVEVVDATAAGPPANETFAEASATRGDITVTITKVEFADTETRVFLTVENNSSYGCSFYASSGKAVTGNGQQFEAEYGGDYPDVSTSIVSGAFSSGVVVFPALDSTMGVGFLFEGSSENSNVGKYGQLEWGFAYKA